MQSGGKHLTEAKKNENLNLFCIKLNTFLDSLMKYLFYILLLIIVFSSCKKEEYTVEQKSSEWLEYEHNPIIKLNKNFNNILWDNPCVLKDSSGYKMWLSGGEQGKKRSIYYASSNIETRWLIDTTVALEPGFPGSWDDKEVRSPAVVVVDSVYHLYYAGFGSNSMPRQYSIGHAVSYDGLLWHKDPENPIITYHNDKTKWGYYQANAPGVMFYENKFYLYYSTAKERVGYDDVRKLQQGIALAISDDGRKFTNYTNNDSSEISPVLVLSENYPLEEYFAGYSTPSPIVDAVGTVHLFYDVTQYQNKTDWQQVALAHATSRDGLGFKEKEYSFFTNGQEDWKNYEIRSPSVILDGDVFKMWFAGNNEFFPESNFTQGIGYATNSSK